MPTPADLNSRFAIPDRVAFDTGRGGLTRIKVSHPSAYAEIYLHGAHVASFKPTGHDPVLFMSEKSWHEEGKPVRGGVPVCFPWFGARENDPAAPPHGFVRLHDWDVESVDTESTGALTILLSTSSTEETKKLWPCDFELKHRVTLDAALTMSLEMRNAGRGDLAFEEALHTYFHVADVRRVRVHGLEGAKYLSKVEGGVKTQDKNPITVNTETDRVYGNATGPVTIEDRGLKRRILIHKTRSRTTVVWNPWIAKAKAMPDFGDDEWPHMLCVETANARNYGVMLQPGGRHSMTARITVERITA